MYLKSVYMCLLLSIIFDASGFYGSYRIIGEYGAHMRRGKKITSILFRGPKLENMQVGAVCWYLYVQKVRWNSESL